MAQDHDRYTYRVIWSQDDEEHVGLCAEFPSLSWLAPTPEKALKGIRDVISDVVSDLQANNEPCPKPLNEKKYSGKFMVRVTPQLHQRLAIDAAESGVSLNRLINAKLSQ
ncbi:MAG: type II toxin-antitoxin system HicB family antitoxin [Rhodospirillaceae bacterium]|jgi:predicted HicB family RNase H-like nuclease|nr:type II toxin-antitoxin system HicB family antitoxin [Candidatus Latescibacterota bacterium]MBT5753259.1 type II toxin-antitoxin system HicB family antitoxin [Rhodospirillaceae bacterium]